MTRLSQRRNIRRYRGDMWRDYVSYKSLPWVINVPGGFVDVRGTLSCSWKGGGLFRTRSEARLALAAYKARS